MYWLIRLLSHCFPSTEGPKAGVLFCCHHCVSRRPSSCLIPHCQETEENPSLVGCVFVQSRTLDSLCRTRKCSAFLWDASQLIQPENVDRILGKVRPTYCMLAFCPLWSFEFDPSYCKCLLLIQQVNLYWKTIFGGLWLKQLQTRFECCIFEQGNHTCRCLPAPGFNG